MNEKRRPHQNELSVVVGGKSAEQGGALGTGQPTDRKMPQDALVTVSIVKPGAALRTCAMMVADRWQARKGAPNKSEEGLRR